MEWSLSARWLTSLVPVKRYHHVAKSNLRKKLCKTLLNSPTVVKVFENKFDQVVEKSFESISCLFGFVSNFIHKAKFFLQSAEKPRYEFSATVLRSTCKQRFSLQWGRVRTTGDKGKLFVLSIPLFTLFLFSKSVCSLWLNQHQDQRKQDLEAMFWEVVVTMKFFLALGLWRCWRWWRL